MLLLLTHNSQHICLVLLLFQRSGLKNAFKLSPDAVKGQGKFWHRLLLLLLWLRLCNNLRLLWLRNSLQLLWLWLCSNLSFSNFSGLLWLRLCNNLGLLLRQRCSDFSFCNIFGLLWLRLCNNFGLLLRQRRRLGTGSMNFSGNLSAFGFLLLLLLLLGLLLLLLGGRVDINNHLLVLLLLLGQR